MSLAESCLNRLCNYVRRKTGQTLAVMDLKGQGINRAKEYLSRVAGLKKIWETSAWHEVQVASDVRNAIAHSDGISERESIVNYAKSSPHLTLKSLGEIHLEKTYASHVVSQVEVLHHAAIEELRSVGG